MDDLIQEMLEPEKPAPGVVARRRRFVATTAIIGLAVVGVTSLTTSALFTSEDDSSQSGFISGSILIDAGETQWTASPAIAAPGDTYFMSIPVENKGTLQLRYAMELSASAEAPGGGASTLLDHLTYSVYTDAAQCSASGVSTLTPASSALLSSTSNNSHQAIGDRAQGAQTTNGGDRVLDVDGSEVLCLEVDFSINAGNAVQLHSADLAFSFFAEQTANNP